MSIDTQIKIHAIVALSIGEMPDEVTDTTVLTLILKVIVDASITTVRMDEWVQLEVVVGAVLSENVEPVCVLCAQISSILIIRTCCGRVLKYLEIVLGSPRVRGSNGVGAFVSPCLVPIQLLVSVHIT